MKGKKLFIRMNTNVDIINVESSNYHFLKEHNKFASELLSNFNTLHDVEIKKNSIIIKNENYTILNIKESHNNILYTIEKNKIKYLFKKSKNVFNANLNILNFLNITNLNIDDVKYWEKKINMQINDALYEKKYYLQYENLINIFNNNLIKVDYINQGFLTAEHLKITKQDCIYALNDSNRIRLRLPPSTIILMKYLEKSDILRNMFFINDIKLFDIYVILLYIFGYTNYNGYFHNDIKSNNIMIKKETVNIHFNQLNNIKLQFVTEYNPIIIDYSNSKKVNACYPFDIYLITRLFANNPIPSQGIGLEPDYLNKDGKYIKILNEILSLLEQTYPDINTITLSDRLNSDDFYIKLGHDKNKYMDCMEKMFKIINKEE